jgi:alkyl hydroperoxide reductase subunit AhpC
VAEHRDQVCPAKWKPGIELVGGCKGDLTPQA